MATWNFLTNLPAEFTINNLASSGLGFYSSTFGASVPVGSYQDTTYVTNANGTVQSVQTNNVKYLNTASGILNSASSGVGLLSIPNYLSTLIAEFNHSSAVKLQNTKVYIYDRSSINNAPSGVTCKVAEIAHPATTQLGAIGSGSAVWQTPAGSSYFPVAFYSPGRSGLRPNGPQTTDTYHTHYFALTASPDSIGSKTQFAFYIEAEYL